MNDLTVPLPTKFTESVTDQICDLLIEGKSLREICTMEGMPSKTTVMKWLRQYDSFADQYARAREAQGDTDADDIGYIARQAAAGAIDASQARAAIDGLKWCAGKRQPKKYGDSFKHELSGSVEIKVRAEELTDDELAAIAGAK